MQKANKNREEIRSIFEEACSKSDPLIFVMPYLRFEAQFAHLEGNEVHASVAGREDALYSLRVADLKLRFPYNLNYLEAPAKLIGVGSCDGRKTIKFLLPQELYEHDDRKAGRVARVERIFATLSTPDYRIIEAVLMDISSSGAKLRSRVPLDNSLIKANDKIMVTIPIPGVATINNSAVVHYVNNREFGVEYVPHLTASVLDPLSSWIFRKREAERSRIALRSGETAETKASAEPARGKREYGILLITADDDIGAALDSLLSEGRAFCRIQPAAAPLRKMLDKKPHLAIIHVADGNLEEKRLLKALAAMIPKDVPVLLLGTGVDSQILFELGQDWQAAASMTWAKEKGTLIQRLVLGMLRKHYGQGEGPLA